VQTRTRKVRIVYEPIKELTGEPMAPKLCTCTIRHLVDVEHPTFWDGGDWVAWPVVLEMRQRNGVWRYDFEFKLTPGPGILIVCTDHEGQCIITSRTIRGDR